jgi:hypothetical protein
MKKFGLSLLLILTSLLTITAQEVDGIYYSFNEELGEAVVTYRGAEEEDGWMYFSASELYVDDVVIPAEVTYNGKSYSVTGIGTNAFAGSKYLTSLSLPSTITYFGEDVFPLCQSLHTILVDENNPHYFVYSGVLYSRNPDAIFYVPRALSGMVEILDGVKEIPSTAFNLCSFVEQVVIPNSVQTIKDGAFFRCTSLTDVTIGSGVTSIMRDAFSDCTSLEVIKIPSNVKTIGGSAFSGCTNLFYLILNEGLETIESYAFYGCSSIFSVLLPSSLKSIGEKAFYDCVSLSSVLNESPLEIELGSESNGYVAYYANEILTTDILEVGVVEGQIVAEKSALRFFYMENRIIEVFDIVGNCVYRGVVPHEDFSLGGLKSGVYLVNHSGMVEKVLLK